MGRLEDPQKLVNDSRQGFLRALVVEADPELRATICVHLQREGFAVTDAGDASRARTTFRTHIPDVVVVDEKLGAEGALDLLPFMMSVDPKPAVFVVAGHSSVDIAVKSLKLGAEGVLTTPFDASAWMREISECVTRRLIPRPCTCECNASSPLFGYSQASRRLQAEVERLRDTDCPVLILGETGVGKSMLARYLHEISPRREQPFIDLNCGALSREFVESEVFGHERGAFTGAHASKTGLLEAADRGTFFLDEIGDIDMAVQPKLLKVVEERRFRRMGDVRERSVDVRLIAATHRDLPSQVRAGTFRADFYYRINTVTLTVPALRERREDIGMLAREILAATCKARGRRSPTLGHQAEAKLVEHGWPGNVRELKNVLERALIVCDGASIGPGDLRFDDLSAIAGGSPPMPSGRLEAQELALIRHTLDETHGRVSMAALRLGIPRSTLYEKVKRHQIDLTRWRRSPR